MLKCVYTEKLELYKYYRSRGKILQKIFDTHYCKNLRRFFFLLRNDCKKHKFVNNSLQQLKSLQEVPKTYFVLQKNVNGFLSGDKSVIYYN